MKPGIYRGISNEEYHAGPGLSKSSLALILKNQKKFHFKHIAKEAEDESTAAMEFGSAYHTFVLEPDDFASRYILDPCMPKRKKEDKAKWEQWQKEHEGIKLLSQDDIDKLIGMRNSLHSHEMAHRILLEEGEAELSVYAELEGVLVKCRPDKLTTNGIIADLKSTDDASREAFSKQCFNLKYHVQAAFYMDICAAAGVVVDHFMFVAQEKKKPYSIAIYFAPERMIELGRMEYRAGLELYKKCMGSGEWNDYNDGEIVPIDLPVWGERQIEAQYA